MSEKPYNLLDEPWIPVRCASGKIDWIRPRDVTRTEDPPERVESGRADFDSALTQFLIGLVQTTCTPEHEKAWRDWAKKPPTAAELDAKFAPVRDAFFLTGHKYLFMQDVNTPRPTNEDDNVPIEKLLISGTTGQKSGVFAKAAEVPALGFPAACWALLCIQLHAPGVGTGHRTSIRGGCPLTTIHVGPTLWLTTWANVVSSTDKADLPGDPALTSPQATFPWMGPSITSERGEQRLPTQMHPWGHFWSMPQRILLQPSPRGRCAMTGEDGPLFLAYWRKNKGVNYSGGNWKHPLTPYRLQDGGPPISIKGRAARISYRDWLDAALGGGDVDIATVRKVSLRNRRAAVVTPMRWWVSGYWMKESAKPGGFVDVTTPVMGVDEDSVPVLRALLGQLTAAAESVQHTLYAQVKHCLAARREAGEGEGELRGDIGFIREAFFQETEADFYALATRLQDAVNTGTEESAFPPVAEEWLRTLHEAAKRIFSQQSSERGALEALDIRRVAQAWSTLMRFTHPHNKKLREAAGLPEFQRPEQQGAQS